MAAVGSGLIVRGVRALLVVAGVAVVMLGGASAASALDAATCTATAGHPVVVTSASEGAVTVEQDGGSGWGVLGTVQLDQPLAVWTDGPLRVQDGAACSWSVIPTYDDAGLRADLADLRGDVQAVTAAVGDLSTATGDGSDLTSDVAAAVQSQTGVLVSGFGLVCLSLGVLLVYGLPKLGWGARAR